MVGDPGGTHDGAGVVKVGRGGSAVVLDQDAAAAVGALALQQNSRLPLMPGRPRAPGALAQRCHMSKSSDSPQVMNACWQIFLRLSWSAPRGSAGPPPASTRNGGSLPGTRSRPPRHLAD